MTRAIDALHTTPEETYVRECDDALAAHKAEIKRLESMLEHGPRPLAYQYERLRMMRELTETYELDVQARGGAR